MEMLLLLLLLPLLWAGSLQEDPGFELRVQDSVTVQEGLCVHVPCSFSYPRAGGNNSTPTYGSWFQTKDNSKGDVLMATNNPAKGTKRKTRFPFYLLGDPGAGNCSLSITVAQRRHGGNYYFLLDRGLMRHSYKMNRLTVTVRALTQTPDIWVKEPLESGCPSHLTCSVPGACDEATPLTISWTGAALRAPGLDLEASNSSEILLTPRPQDHGTNLTCRVTFPRAGVNTERTITLNVSYAPQNLSISISRRNCKDPPRLLPPSCSWEGEGLHCNCSSQAQPAPTLRWRLGEGLLEGNHNNASWTVTSGSAGPWANSSLSLSGPLGSGLRLSCEAWNVHGKQRKPELGGGFILGAVGGAGVAGLFSLCPCLVFFMVKICRKQKPSGKDAACTLGPLSWGYQHEYPLGTPLARLPPAVAAPTLDEEQDLHYASLTFHGLRPWKPQDLKGPSTTEYSEIKICKR
ncbi:sialic acid-binding Ig-like lectin 11 isoform X2 [Ailuropoda melanoleuca]|uniref:sialic acid-binding Ig-like lectin 11 isoform X2 n=1 Tax=Ailuropoda melanoleuca TaxID=9646 RepID=UPI00149501CC|nr:sialic acid-binding Ig-like lectin 11 isoform X2 [Ailuropoda melanoleuca]